MDSHEFTAGVSFLTLTWNWILVNLPPRRKKPQGHTHHGHCSQPGKAAQRPAAPTERAGRGRSDHPQRAKPAQANCTKAAVHMAPLCHSVRGHWSPACPPSQRSTAHQTCMCSSHFSFPSFLSSLLKPFSSQFSSNKWPFFPVIPCLVFVLYGGACAKQVEPITHAQQVSQQLLWNYCTETIEMQVSQRSSSSGSEFIDKPHEALYRHTLLWKNPALH